VSRGADLGYQVIEEYMRQGQAFARATWAPYMPQERREGVDARALTERMFQYASDFANVFMQYMELMTASGARGGAARAPAERGVPGAGLGGFDLGTRPAAPPPSEPRASGGRPSGGRPVVEKPSPDGTMAETARTPVSIEIASKRRAKVNVDLRRPVANGSLCAHDLRARNPSFPRITGVSIETTPQTGEVLVKIAVPEEQPAATYTGVIVDEVTNVPLGTLTVQILE
jgi:hypothetical protein